MSKTNLDLCFDALTTVLVGTVLIPDQNIERGRRPSRDQGRPGAFMRSRTSPRTTLVSGGFIREYEIEVDLFFRESDVPEGTLIADEMEKLQELLFVACDAKTANDAPFTLLVGLNVIEANQITRDDDEDDPTTKDEIMSRTLIKFPVWESL